jgi:DNA-binding MarR family transcriptional regulator
LGSVTLNQAVERIQFCYPQIYYACHTRHARPRSSPFRLSSRDSDILVHLDTATPTSLVPLARHMDLAASTMSEAISRLEGLGYVAKSSGAPDRRRVDIVLTPRGAAAVRAASVLEARRLAAVLARLRPSDVAAVTNGLGLLARACRDGAARTIRKEV